VRLCREMGYDAQVLYVAFNRFLVAARPRAEATEEELRRQEFDAWREGKLMSLGGRADIKPPPKDGQPPPAGPKRE
jgi:hypothetical protein